MPYIGHIVYPIRITSKEYPLEMADALFSLQRCRNLTIDFPKRMSYIKNRHECRKLAK